MKIIPQDNIVYLKIEEPKVGNLVTSSRPTAIEFAEVLAVGKGANYKVGDKIFVKAWSIDIISYNDEKYHFVNIETGGILAVVK